ncbi:MAG: PHP domain-containing protein [Eubacteriales bacterium]
MRQYLLPKNAHPYKVNMHSHSVYSDGSTTPEQIKQAYKARGYSAVAFTEHEMLFDFTELNDDDFIAITSYEYDFNKADGTPSVYHSQEKPASFSFQECMHLNLYPRDPHNVKMVCFNPKQAFCGNAGKYVDQAQYIGDGNYRQAFTVECFNDVIKTARENGFLVVYNHPLWSMNTHETYANLKGLHGMEIINGGSYAPHVYDEMARSGQRLFCVGGDDNHGPGGYGRAWTVIFAEELKHEALIDALERGDCYASFGPEIHEMWIEDRELHVRCSEAQSITYSGGGRSVSRVNAPKGESVTEAVFAITPPIEYFRITVKDADGRCANSRTYYLDELADFKKES